MLGKISSVTFQFIMTFPRPDIIWTQAPASNIISSLMYSALVTLVFLFFLKHIKLLPGLDEINLCSPTQQTLPQDILYSHFCHAYNCHFLKDPLCILYLK